MQADLFTKLFTNSSSFAHVLNIISIITQDTVPVSSNRTRLRTKTPVALPRIPVLMSKPPGYGNDAGSAATASGHSGNAGDVAERFPKYKQPQPPVLSLSGPRSNSRVRFDAFSLKSPPAEPTSTSSSPAPPGRTLRTQPVLVSELSDPWVAGAKAIMQESRPIPPRHLSDPWDARPLAVRQQAVDTANRSHTTSVVRGASISSAPQVAVPKEPPMTTVSPSHHYIYTMNA